MKRRWWYVALACVAAPAIACSSSETALIVEVTSPLGVPADVDQLEFGIAGETSGAMVERRFAIESAWPHSLAVEARSNTSEQVVVTVTGRKLAGTEEVGAFVVRRVARAQFVEGETRTVRVELTADCVGVECPDGVDCVMGSCETPATDGGMDGGTPDAGPGDTGMPDAAECGAAADCDDGVACTVDTCDTGVCTHTADNSLCAEGTSCDPTTGCPLRACATDEDCNDGRPCNGMETCAGGTCVPGAALECDDGVTCTDDRCDNDLRGCVYATHDGDGDGFGDQACAAMGMVPATDCNDASPDIFPGAPEDCNGADDDCDGSCDDPFTCCRGEFGTCMSACGTMGMRVCTTACSWGVCSPPAEVCNGIDDDCNGAADEVFACVGGQTQACTTSCGTMGTRSCDEATCSWGACTPPAETCNGRDDDCDGAIDDGFACMPGSTTSCTTSCGSTGTIACTASCTIGTTCTPPAEACNGRDDDCDGRIDESVECAVGSTGSCTTSCGSTGSRTCSSTCTWGTCNPPAEACNGRDDDCDGMVDDGFACVPGTTSSCTSSCGSTGSRTCTSSCTWGACTAPAEICNGADDDCDGVSDDGFACVRGATASCTTSCMTSGTQTCGPSCSFGTCTPPAETCNGRDDDCDAVCDNGFACCQGATGSCTTSCGSTGSRTCSASCGWGACAPPAEICNAADDDCDGTIDDGFACVRGRTESCTTSCGSSGTRTCGSSCAWGTCAPPPEACNGVDDNCDGMVDEGCGMCASCGTTATTVVAPGGRYNVALRPHAQTGSCGGAGSEAYLTFTLTATSDVFISTHGASFDTVVYVRDCTCTGRESGCNDDADGRTSSTLRLQDLRAGTYNVFVDTKAAMSASLNVDVYITPSGTAGDRCGDAIPIAPGAANVSGNNCSFANDYDIVLNTECSSSYIGNGEDVVYYFYLPTSRTVTISGCNAITDYDSALWIRDVCTNAAVSSQVACNDDGCSGGWNCSGRRRSAITATLGPGLYYLFVDAWDNNDPADCLCGNYRFDLTGF